MQKNGNKFQGIDLNLKNHKHKIIYKYPFPHPIKLFKLNYNSEVRCIGRKFL